jgi:hypothetical protein
MLKPGSFRAMVNQLTHLMKAEPRALRGARLSVDSSERNALIAVVAVGQNVELVP